MIREKKLSAGLCSLLGGLSAGFLILAFGPAGIEPSATSAQGLSSLIYSTTLDYVEEFYPLWFMYEQSSHSPANRLVGPDRISPLYHEVVAINDDTLYESVQ